MGDVDLHHPFITSSSFSALKKVIFLCITFSSLFPYSFTNVAPPQPHVSLTSANISKFPQSSQDQGAKFQGNSYTKVGGGSSGDEINKRYLYLLLAQQEAKCLQEFLPRKYPNALPKPLVRTALASSVGKLEPAISFEFPQDLFRPFVCLEASRNFSACEQCIKIIREVRVGDNVSQATSCQSICHVSSALPNCTQRCEEFVQSLVNGVARVTNDTEAAKGELSGESRCKQNECSLKVEGSEASSRDDATSGAEKYSNVTLTTHVFCESISQFLSDTRTTFNSMLTTELQKQGSACRHFVFLKSYFSGGVNAAVAKRDGPLVFVIEQREFVSNASEPTRDGRGHWTGWRVLGKSTYGFDKIQVAYRQQTYQWRVTAVGILGPIAASIVKSFETIDGYMEPGPPSRVFVIEKKPKASAIDVLLGWDPPQERACFYKIVLETRNEEEFSRTVRIKGVPLGVHKVWFKRLRFSSTYEVRITSRSAEWHENESTHAGLSFTTPTCLDVHQFRFDKCAPPPPRNLSYVTEVASSSKVMDAPVNSTALPKRYFTAHLHWQSPAHASETNVIQRYVVDITRAFSWSIPSANKSRHDFTVSRSDLIDHPNLLTHPIRLDLPGNVTHAKVDNLDDTVEYTVRVYALSSKGSSPPATLTVKFNSVMGSEDTTVGFWVYPSGLVITFLVVASAYLAVRKISRRRKIKAARDSYFKSIDQRDAYTEDWSVLSLTEDPNNTWKVLEENSFPKDKWHVGFQDLTIGDIIGQGAFGIVRKAKIRSDKYLELQKRHNGRTPDVRDQFGSTHLDVDGTEMETVALKMLRVAATKADREGLMKELKTMQSLGIHPQIVTLLGVCTTPKSMYLVLEYCPGGDLLSFLRKFREKYLPLLNLECGAVIGTQFENPGFRSPLHGYDVVKTKQIDIDDELEQVHYTVLHHNEIASSSPEIPNDSQGAAKGDTETDSPGGSGQGGAECESISEKDVLSYAHQVALGMAYLERNHIIHRDLACRNILVMGDHKHVKISDFGLSRDVYTGNIYQQKTAGKMPFKWMAIESITSRIFTSKSDVWSYGIVLWELVTLGAEPYPALENQELLNMLRTGYRMERPDNCSEELYALMRKCWRIAPADRPNFSELISYLGTMIETEPKLYLSLQT